MKQPRCKLAPTIPGVFVQAVAREGTLGEPPREYPYSVEAIAVTFGLNPEGGTKG